MAHRNRSHRGPQPHPRLCDSCVKAAKSGNATAPVTDCNRTRRGPHPHHPCRRVRRATEARRKTLARSEDMPDLRATKTDLAIPVAPDVREAWWPDVEAVFEQQWELVESERRSVPKKTRKRQRVVRQLWLMVFDVCLTAYTGAGLKQYMIVDNHS